VQYEVEGCAAEVDSRVT